MGGPYKPVMTRKILVLLVAQLLLALPAFAQDTLPVKVHTFEVGLETYYMKYEEPGLMENKGWMYGVTGSYTYHNRLMARLEARVAMGEVDYSSVNTGSDEGISDKAFEARGLLGYDFRVGAWLLTPYIGIGYRYLNDDSQGTVTSTGHLGYERESNYYYSPLGIEAVVPLNERWRLTLTGELDLFWSGKQKSHLSGAVSGLNDIENDQNKGLGARGSLSFQRKLGTTTMSFGAFARFWWIDDSEYCPITQGGALLRNDLEPENRTYEVGVMFSLYF
jgi:hypothetical protein